jgi:hypothetical protein
MDSQLIRLAAIDLLATVPWARAGSAIPLGTTMASTSPEIAQQVDSHGYQLVKGHTMSQPHLRKNDSTPYRALCFLRSGDGREVGFTSSSDFSLGDFYQP